MSAGATVVFTADLSAAYQAYAAFLAYVRANPAQAQFGGGPGRPGGGGPTYITNNITNNYGSGGGPGTGGGGGGGGTGGGGGGLRGSGLGRYLTTGFILREALRMADAGVEWSQDMAGAGSAAERYKAEQKLQRRLFGVPIVGQVAELAAAPYTARTAATAEQAEQGGRVADLMQKTLESQLRLNQQALAYAAGPAGSFGYNRQTVESQYQQDRLRIQREATARLEENERSKTQEFGRAGGLASWFGLDKKEQDRIEADASQSANSRKAGIEADRRRQDAAAAAERDARLKEIQYQKERETRSARDEAEHERIEYERKYNVAEAQDIYSHGSRAVEAARHRGNADAARAEAESATYRLLRLQYKLMFGGTAEAVDLANIDFGQGKTGYIQGDPLKLDDIQEALLAIRGYLADIATQTKDL